MLAPWEGIEDVIEEYDPLDIFPPPKPPAGVWFFLSLLALVIMMILLWAILKPALAQPAVDASLKGWMQQYAHAIYDAGCAGSDGFFIPEEDWLVLDDGRYMIRLGANWYRVETTIGSRDTPNPSGHAIVFAAQNKKGWLTICGFAPGWTS